MAHWHTSFAVALLALAACHADEVLFQDDFQKKLGEGWSWVRGHREAWRATERGLEVRIEPGNMWGPANNARNVLVHSLPGATDDAIEISAMKVRVYGDTDLVNITENVKGHLGETDISGQYRTVRVWVKRKGQWQSVSNQFTRLAQQPYRAHPTWLFCIEQGLSELKQGLGPAATFQFLLNL
jgi:hypothetical protein